MCIGSLNKLSNYCDYYDFVCTFGYAVEFYMLNLDSDSDSDSDETNLIKWIYLDIYAKFSFTEQQAV